MEKDGEERPYSVLTRDEVKEKMKKQIDEISEIFLVPKSDATVLLMYLRWDSVRGLERLGDNMEKLLTESGLKPVVIDSSDNSCGICSKIVGDDSDVIDDAIISMPFCYLDDDALISTPFCSHKFCKTCWSQYLVKNFFSVEKIQTAISCPHRDCRAAVGPDTIEKLTVRDQEMYDKYILRSYLEGILAWKMKQCPAPGCNYAIEFDTWSGDEEHSLNVVCLCGHIFCWRCMLESHRPVTCNNASDWLSRDLKSLLEESNKSRSLSWIEANTKTCPHCLFPVECDGLKWNKFVTCACSGRFCWKCLWPEEAHETGVFSTCVEPKLELKIRETVENLCLERWEASQNSMEQAKLDLQAFEGSKIKKPSTFGEQHTKAIREGLMLVVQCRQVLKWSCVYDYLHTEYEASKREYLRVLQDQAAALVQSYSETLKKEIERAFSAASDEKIIGVSHEVFKQRSDIGNYFYHFIKTLQDGLVEVKVKSYDNYGGPYWLCDRCTYGNSWFHKACKSCCDPTASNMEELSD